MLRRISKDENGACVGIDQADFPEPFKSGLEYNAPARGAWNIVHTGMLLPESHQIFICAANCLRGVVMTAAEMGASNRFSTVTVMENNVLDGDMEELIIEGVTDILRRLPKMPRAVLVFTSCIHHFMGCDLPMCYKILRERFPEAAFADCYMIPTMRKSGLTPEQLMRKQLYSLLKPQIRDERSINIIGNNIATDESSDLSALVRRAGYKLRDITGCVTYEDYQELATSILNISYNPVAAAAGEELERRLGQKHLYLPLCYGAEEIRENMRKLAEELHCDYDGGLAAYEEAENALARACALIGETPIAVDYTATMRPLGLARLLAEHGFNIQKVYADAYSQEEREDFNWLKASRPDLRLYATVHAGMRALPRTGKDKILAIGQKAAYFNSTDYFVNIVEGGGMYGFDGIKRLARLMEDAYLNKKHARDIIERKALGCISCI